jgi:hypothetical protein
MNQESRKNTGQPEDEFTGGSVVQDDMNAIPAPIITADSQSVLPEKPPPAWRAYRIRGYIAAIVISIILLYFLNNLLNLYVPWIPSDFSRFFWNILNNVYNHVEIPFLSRAYMQCLWAVNIALSFSIMGNFFLLVFRPRWFQYLIRGIIFGSGILAAYVIYAIYPFKIDSAAVNNTLKAIIIIGIAGLSAGVIFSLIKCLTSFKQDKTVLEDKVPPFICPV